MTTDEEIKQMADVLWQEQERLKPYLTVRRVAELLGYKNHYSAQLVLKRMAEMGIAKAFSFGAGERHRWRVKKP